MFNPGISWFIWTKSNIPWSDVDIGRLSLVKDKEANNIPDGADEANKKSIMTKEDIGDLKCTPLKDIFKFTGTHGIPLELFLELLKEKGYLIDWLDWIQAAKKDGWNNKTIFLRIETSIGEVYGSLYKKNFMTRLEKIKEIMNE
jgi:hypothetical protein